MYAVVTLEYVLTEILVSALGCNGKKIGLSGILVRILNLDLLFTLFNQNAEHFGVLRCNNPGMLYTTHLNKFIKRVQVQNTVKLTN